MNRVYPQGEQGGSPRKMPQETMIRKGSTGIDGMSKEKMAKDTSTMKTPTSRFGTMPKSSSKK